MEFTCLSDFVPKFATNEINYIYCDKIEIEVRQTECIWRRFTALRGRNWTWSVLHCRWFWVETSEEFGRQEMWNPDLKVQLFERFLFLNKKMNKIGVWGIFGWLGGMIWSYFTVRWQTVLRIWDCLFSEGSTVLLRVGLVIISKHSDAILHCRSTADILDVLRGIPASPHVTRCHEFMQVILLCVCSLFIATEHSFPHNAEFWAEPQNLPVSTEF